MNIIERFQGCIIAGAIGDAQGSAFENITQKNDDSVPFFDDYQEIEQQWKITDDTQLTLATIEAMNEDKNTSPQKIAEQFVKYYRSNKLIGIGASTLKAMKELDFGNHWSLVGRKGEYAAGNGAAMRIAPLAFRDNIPFSQIRDICSITHHNDEAYVGALSTIIAIREILNNNWTGKENLIKLITPQIPDTRVKDRLIKIQEMDNLKDIGKLGNDGYVVNSIPLAIAAANKVNEIGIENVFKELIDIGGDTDTNCSIAGQIAGALIGIKELPTNLVHKLKNLKDYQWINDIICKFIKKEKWC